MTEAALIAHTGNRDILLADYRDGGALVGTWLFPPLDRTDGADVGETYGFHPSFARLVAELSGDSRSEDAKAFITRVLETAAPDKDSLAVVRLWFLRSWSGGLSARLVGTPEFDGAQQIIALVEASLERTVAPREWRTARSAFARMGNKPGGDRYADVVLAMAFDLDQAPGAAGDVAAAWAGAISRTTLLSCGWTDDLSEEAWRLDEAIHKKAADGLDMTDREEAIRLFKERTEALTAASPRMLELSVKRDECRAVVNVERRRWLEQARGDLLALVV